MDLTNRELKEHLRTWVIQILEQQREILKETKEIKEDIKDLNSIIDNLQIS